MDKYSKTFNGLCSPAMFFFVVSMIATIFVLFQNIGKQNSYHAGSFSCRVPSTAIIFIFKLIYILFWTYVLNLICKDGHPGLSWLLVLLPWLLLLFSVIVIMMNM